MRLFSPIPSALLAAILAAPTFAADRAVINAPVDENAAEGNVFMNAKLIAIQSSEIQVRDNDGKKRTLALDSGATIEPDLKAGTEVIVAIKEEGQQSKVLSVKSTAPRSRKQSALTVVPATRDADETTRDEPSTQTAYVSGTEKVPAVASDAPINYGGFTVPAFATQPRPAIRRASLAPGSDAQAVPLQQAVRAYEATVARLSAKAADADRAYGTYQQTCGELRSTLRTTDPHDADARAEWASMMDSATLPDTGDTCDPLLVAAVGLGREVRQELNGAEDAARRSGVLPGVMRQIRTAYGLDWSGWDQ